MFENLDGRWRQFLEQPRHHKAHRIVAAISVADSNYQHRTSGNIFHNRLKEL
jgi:hypothetical protein